MLLVNDKYTYKIIPYSSLGSREFCSYGFLLLGQVVGSRFIAVTPYLPSYCMLSLCLFSNFLIFTCHWQFVGNARREASYTNNYIKYFVNFVFITVYRAAVWRVESSLFPDIKICIIIKLRIRILYENRIFVMKNYNTLVHHISREINVLIISIWRKLKRSPPSCTSTNKYLIGIL